MKYDFSLDRAAFEQPQLFLLFLSCLLTVMISGCDATIASMEGPIWELARPGFCSVAHTEPHGTLILQRSTPYMLVWIDGRLLKDDRGRLELYLNNIS